jgi:hypothetical protein
MNGIPGTLAVLLLFGQPFSFQGSGKAAAALTKSKPQYEIGGPYEERDGLTLAEKNQMHANIRSFLWDHLREKRLARLQATGYTIEGDKTTNTFFVDADAKGNWGIRSEWVQWRRIHPSGNIKRDSGKESYCEVSRIDPENDQIIPNEQERSRETYILRLIACVTSADRTW